MLITSIFSFFPKCFPKAFSSSKVVIYDSKEKNIHCLISDQSFKRATSGDPLPPPPPQKKKKKTVSCFILFTVVQVYKF